MEGSVPSLPKSSKISPKSPVLSPRLSEQPEAKSIEHLNLDKKNELPPLSLSGQIAQQSVIQPYDISQQFEILIQMYQFAEGLFKKVPLPYHTQLSVASVLRQKLATLVPPHAVEPSLNFIFDKLYEANPPLKEYFARTAIDCKYKFRWTDESYRKILFHSFNFERFQEEQCDLKNLDISKKVATIFSAYPDLNVFYDRETAHTPPCVKLDYALPVSTIEYSKPQFATFSLRGLTSQKQFEATLDEYIYSIKLERPDFELWFVKFVDRLKLNRELGSDDKLRSRIHFWDSNRQTQPPEELQIAYHDFIKRYDEQIQVLETLKSDTATQNQWIDLVKAFNLQPPILQISSQEKPSKQYHSSQSILAQALKNTVVSEPDEKDISIHRDLVPCSQLTMPFPFIKINNGHLCLFQSDPDPLLLSHGDPDQTTCYLDYLLNKVGIQWADHPKFIKKIGEYSYFELDDPHLSKIMEMLNQILSDPFNKVDPSFRKSIKTIEFINGYFQETSFNESTYPKNGSMEPMAPLFPIKLETQTLGVFGCDIYDLTFEYFSQLCKISDSIGLKGFSVKDLGMDFLQHPQRGYEQKVKQGIFFNGILLFDNTHSEKILQRMTNFLKETEFLKAAEILIGANADPPILQKVESDLVHCSVKDPNRFATPLFNSLRRRNVIQGGGSRCLEMKLTDFLEKIIYPCVSETEQPKFYQDIQQLKTQFIPILPQVAIQNLQLLQNAPLAQKMETPWGQKIGDPPEFITGLISHLPPKMSLEKIPYQPDKEHELRLSYDLDLTQLNAFDLTSPKGRMVQFLTICDLIDPSLKAQFIPIIMDNIVKGTPSLTVSISLSGLVLHQLRQLRPENQVINAFFNETPHELADEIVKNPHHICLVPLTKEGLPCRWGYGIHKIIAQQLLTLAEKQPEFLAIQLKEKLHLTNLPKITIDPIVKKSLKPHEIHTQKWPNGKETPFFDYENDFVIKCDDKILFNSADTYRLSTTIEQYIKDNFIGHAANISIAKQESDMFAVDPSKSLDLTPPYLTSEVLHHQDTMDDRNLPSRMISVPLPQLLEWCIKLQK